MLSQRLRELSFLNAGVRIQIADERTEKSHDFCYEGGIVSFVEHLNRSRQPLHQPPIFVSGERKFETHGGTRRRSTIEIALQYNDTYNENVFSFANNINTIEGGTHLIGFRTALTRTLNRYLTAQKKNGKGEAESVSGDDVREGLTAVISVKLPQPEFEGQTKTKLGNSEVRGLVEALVYEQLAVAPRGESRQSHARSSRRSSTPRARARRRARRATSRAARALSRRQPARQARRLPGTRSRELASSSSSRATRPAAPPSRAARARPRRSCRSAARS